jgi:hypothetical protein
LAHLLLHGQPIEKNLGRVVPFKTATRRFHRLLKNSRRV